MNIEAMIESLETSATKNHKDSIASMVKGRRSAEWRMAAISQQGTANTLFAIVEALKAGNEKVG